MGEERRGKSKKKKRTRPGHGAIGFLLRTIGILNTPKKKQTAALIIFSNIVFHNALIPTPPRTNAFPYPIPTIARFCLSSASIPLS